MLRVMPMSERSRDRRGHPLRQIENTVVSPGRAVVEIGSGEQDGKLVAADSGDDVGAAHRGLKDGADRGEGRVAGGMTVGVVERFEEINVGHHHAQ